MPRSWVLSANDPDSDFPLENLPYGVFRFGETLGIGVAIGDQVLDLRRCAVDGLQGDLGDRLIAACSAETLNPLMSLGWKEWARLRAWISALLDADRCEAAVQRRTSRYLVPMLDVEMQLPVSIGDYTDFYASIDHARRVGELFRPGNPLLPNYKYLPNGYGGRASSVVISGSEVRRPRGQIKGDGAAPVFEPTRRLDYEMELGAFVGPGNGHGEPIPISEAEHHIFGLCILNDWSARDIQQWESQPLGPFLGKSFATTISPWIVPLEALAPYRLRQRVRPEGDPPPLEYLRSPASSLDAFDVTIEAHLQTAKMDRAGLAPVLLSRANAGDLYWSLPQLLTHHTSNGCNLRTGDLLGSGTISGAVQGSEGCLLEKRLDARPLQLPSGETRVFLEDGDTVILCAYSQRPGLPRIGFGECRGTVGSSRG